MQVMIDRPSRADMLGASDPEGTAPAAARVREARERAARRLAGTPWTVSGTPE